MRTCGVSDCDNPHDAGGFCTKHYGRFKRHGNPLAAVKGEISKLCNIPDCGNLSKAKGFCPKHYLSYKHYGDPLHISNKKKQYIQKRSNTNYWKISCPCHPNADSQGYVLGHRLMMEIQLGRFLSKKEIIHHIDGDGLNNNFENLHLFTRQEHEQFHQKRNRLARLVKVYETIMGKATIT